MRVRRVPPAGALFWSVAIALTIGCTKTAAVPPTTPTEGTTPAVPPPTDDERTAAYAGHETAEQGTAARVRPQPAEVHHRDDALQAVRRGNPEGAIAFLAPLVAGQPDDLEARLALARAQIQVGALADAQRVLAEPAGAPEDPAVVAARADLAWRRGDIEQAERLLDTALAKNPDAIPLQGRRLAIMSARGLGDEPAARALMNGLYDAYDESRATSAAQLAAVAQAALARGSSGAFHDANMVLGDAEQLAPVDQGDWTGDRIILLRGRMFLTKYAHTDAVETFDLLLARDPWHPDALAGKAQVLMNSLRFADAARVAGEALQVDPHHPDAHVILGRIALIEGRRQEAKRRAADEALTVNPMHPGAHAVLAALAIVRDDTATYERHRDEALRLDRQGRRFFVDLADMLGFLHLYPESDRVLQEAATLAPEDPNIASALGLNQLRLGQEQQGRDALARAWKRDRFNERTRNVLDLYDETIDRHYSEQTKAGITVRLPNQDREFIEPALRAAAERSRRELDDFYGISAGDLRLEFFADPQSFSVRTVGVPSLGALAVCFGPVITFMGPYSGEYNIEMVIRHELSHTYAIALSGGRVPRWFTEGLSEWESELLDPSYARESVKLLAQAKQAGKLRRLSELELAFIRAENAMMMEVAYATAAYAIRYLGQTYGRPALVEILRGYRTGGDTATLFREHFGKDLPTIEREFEAWFFAQLRQGQSGWEPTRKGKGDERDELMRAAIEQARAGDTAEATRTLQSLIAKRGDGFVPRMMLAKLLLDGPDPAAAERHLKAAAGHHPEAMEPLVELANLARKKGSSTEEKQHLAAALALDGNSLEPAARMLMLATVTDDTVQRDTALARARAIAPLHPIVLAAIALRDKDNKALGRALRDLEPGRGPADTFVVAALAAAALGKAEDARTLAAAALKDKKLPKAARDRLTAL